MTRVATLSSMKGSCGRPLQQRPKEGTKLRDLYDRYRRGEEVHYTLHGRSTGRYRDQLMDYYGMEIIASRLGYTKLKGEWEGTYFVPLERIVQQEADNEE